MPITTRRPSFSVATTPVWIRWMPFWHGLSYVTLVVATGVDLIGESHTWQHKSVQLGLSLALGLWYGICVVRSPLSWQKHPLFTMVYFIVGWTLWFGLTELNPVFLFILTGLYPQVFMLPPLPGKILGAFLLTALSAWRQVMLAGGIDGNLFLMLAAAVSGIIMGLFIYAIVEQSQQRQRLIGELEGTRQALAAAERQSGIMEERQRLAGEIHDTLAQGFTSIVMHLEAAEAAFPDELSTLHHYLNQARRTARENLAEARRVLWALQPAALDRTSLAEALTHLVTRLSEENVVRGLATVTGTPHLLRPEIEVTLLRAAQEALTNANKHARASQVALTLSYMDDMVILDVQDDGIGFDPACLSVSLVGQSANGFGLKALRERVQQLGGTLSIESAPGKGTTIAVALPAMSKEVLSLREVTKEAYR
jgi:signal transduction histidine kinase